MKIITSILIGIIIGIVMSTIYFRSEIDVTHTAPSEQSEPEYPTFSMGDLKIIEGQNFHVIQSTSNNFPLLKISLTDNGIISTVDIIDNHLKQFRFSDLDHDSNWDQWYYRNKSESFGYNQMSGFPDSASVLSESIANEYLVRIDGEYFPVKLSDDKAFVEKDGSKIEVEEYSKNLYRIKQ